MNRNANNLYGWDIIENHGCGLSLQISLFLLPIPRQKFFKKNKFCSVSYITAQKPLDAVDASFQNLHPIRLHFYMLMLMLVTLKQF